MTTTVKFIIACILIIALSIFLSRCKSRNEVKDAEAITAMDSASTANETIDSSETPPVSEAPVAELARTPLTLTIQNLTPTKSAVIIGVYGIKNKFPDPADQLKVYSFKSTGSELTAKITNLKFGTYALAIFQDVNNSGKIDKNIIGIPTEPYAFSNNYKPTVKAPAFNDCSFDYNTSSNAVSMSMIK